MASELGKHTRVDLGYLHELPDLSLKELDQRVRAIRNEPADLRHVREERLYRISKRVMRLTWALIFLTIGLGLIATVQLVEAFSA